MNEIIKYVILGLDILVAATLLIFILKGITGGFQKNIRNFVILLVPIVIFAMFLNPISNTTLNKEITPSDLEKIEQFLPEGFDTTQSYSLKSTLTTVVVNFVYKGDTSYQNDSEVVEVCQSISVMIVRISIYISGIVLILFVIVPLIKGICKIIRQILHIKTKKHFKLLGGLCAALSFVVVFVALFLPIYGIVETASVVASDLSENSEVFGIDEYTQASLEEFSKSADGSYVNNYLIKPVSKFLYKDEEITVAGKFVGEAFSFESNNVKVNSVEEYYNVRKLFPTFKNIYYLQNEIIVKDESGNIKYINLDKLSDEDFNAIQGFIEASDILPFAMPAIIEYIGFATKDNEDVKKLNIDFDSLKKLDWKSQINSIAKIVGVIKNYKNMSISVDDYKQIYNNEKFIDFANDLVDTIFDIQFLNDYILPGVMNYLVEKAPSEDNELGKIFVEFKDVDWKTNLKPLVLCVISVGSDVNAIYQESKTLAEVIDNKNLSTTIENIFDKISENTIVTENLIPGIMNVVIDKLKTNEKTSNLNIDYDDLKTTNWENELPNIKLFLKNLTDAYQNTEFNKDDIKGSLKNSNCQTELKKLSNSIKDIEIVKKFLLPVTMNIIFEEMQKNQTFDKFEFNYDKLKEIDWSAELTALTDTICEALTAYQDLNFNKDEWELVLDNSQLGTYLKNMYNSAKESEAINDYILPNIIKEVGLFLKNKLGSNLSFVTELINQENVDKIFNNDLDKLISITKEVKALGLLDNQELNISDTTTQESIKKLIKDVFSLSVVEGKEDKIYGSLLKITGIDTVLEGYGITLQYDKVTDWNAEVDRLIDIYQNVMSLTGEIEGFDFDQMFSMGTTPEKKELVARTVDEFSSSQLYGDSIYTIIENLLKEQSYDITFTAADKALITTNTWYNETMSILTILDDVKAQIDVIDDSDYSKLDANVVYNLMIKASDSVIASKILGAALNDAFGSQIDYDLTSTDNMRSCAEMVKSAILLSQIISSPTEIDLSNPADADKLIDSISGLATNDDAVDLAVDFIKDMTGNDSLTVTKEDITTSSETVKEVIQEYQNAANKDEFTLDDLSDEAKEKLNNSDLAKEILGYFFD